MACTFDESYPAQYGHKGAYIITPPTTDSAIVFSLDRQSNKFDRGFYSPALTDGRLDSQQLDSFLGEVERILKKKIGPVRKVMMLFTFFTLMGLACFFFLTLCMIGEDLDTTYDSDYTVPYNDELDEGDALFLALFGYVGAVIFYAVLVSLYRRRRYRKAKKAVKALVDRNYPFFAAQGLRWNVPKHFRWIELWKDYRGQQTQTQCTCGQMFRPYGNFMVPIQGQTFPQPQPQYQSYPQQAMIPYMALPMPQNPTNTNYVNRPLCQPFLNQEPSQSVGQYMPPNANNYPNFDE